MLVLRRRDGQWVELIHRSGDVVRIRVYGIGERGDDQVSIAFDDDDRNFEIKRPERVEATRSVRRGAGDGFAAPTGLIEAAPNARRNSSDRAARSDPDSIGARQAIESRNPRRDHSPPLCGRRSLSQANRSSTRD